MARTCCQTCDFPEFHVIRNRRGDKEEEGEGRRVMRRSGACREREDKDGGHVNNPKSEDQPEFDFRISCPDKQGK
jgi:hypothetical protein